MIDKKEQILLFYSQRSGRSLHGVATWKGKTLFTSRTLYFTEEPRPGSRDSRPSAGRQHSITVTLGGSAAAPAEVGLSGSAVLNI